ncbi:MAG: cell division protein SepF [Ruminococcaceae bacterium]|nr:cell division protein SepF [Oscillospiraceae bacterium]
MGFLDKVKEFVNTDELYDGEPEEFGNEGYEEQPAPRATRRERESRFSNDNDNVVNIHTTAQLQVVLAKPETFEEAKKIADNLNQKRTVVLNLESANRDIALRIIDFLTGVAYANDGNLKKVAKAIFIITPYNVNVMGDLLDELESTGVFF